MEKIQAFIGHSFLEKDKEVVEKFLSHIDSIKNLQIPFDWEHAQKAKPEELSTKVYELFNKKNTFIGICTRKEGAIDVEKLKSTTGFNKFYKVHKEEVEYKCSDWIIQEIGFALGRGMKIILLLENGLRIPGGLMGNLEHIDFNREKPEKCFVKITEMIQNLLPSRLQDGKIQISKEVESNLTDDKEEVVSPKTDEEINPLDSWTEKEYERALVNLIYFKKETKKQEIFEKYINKFHKENPSKQNSAKAMCLYYESILADSKNFDEIKDLYKQDENNPDVVFYFALVTRDYDESSNTMELFKKAYELEKSIDKKINYLIHAIKTALKNDDTSYQTMWFELLKLDSKKSHTEQIYSCLYDIGKNTKNDFLIAIAKEAILEDNPADYDSRFNLAHHYYEIGLDELSYHHYNVLKKTNKSGPVLNNLGVSAGNNQMPSKCIKAYFQAVEYDNTLAMNNLASQYISAGFLDDADKMCKRALGIKDHDEGIPDSLLRIRDIVKDENSMEEIVLKTAREKRKLIISLSSKYIQSNIKSIDKDWKYSKCNLEMNLLEDTIIAVGKYSQSSGIFNFAALKGENKQDHYKVEIFGLIKGEIIEAFYYDYKVSEKEVDKARTNSRKEIILSFKDNSKKLIAYDKSNYDLLFELTAINDIKAN